MNWLQSMRVRLLFGGAVWIVLALLLAGIFIVASFEASIEIERRDDLQASLDRLIVSIDPEASAPSFSETLTDPRYETPLSGLYWEIDNVDTGEIVRSRSLWDQELPMQDLVSDSPAGKLIQIPGPDQQTVIVLGRSLVVESSTGDRHFIVAVAEARSRDDDPVKRFGESVLLALCLLGVTLLAAAMLQVHFGLRPLGLLKRQIDAIRTGAAARLPANRAPELQPLTGQINELLDAQDATIAFARQRAGDLAHGLKTPLAILSATSERLRQSGDLANADLLQLLGDQMNNRIEDQLRLARLRFRTGAQGASASLNEVVLRSVAVLRKGSREGLNWMLELDADLRVDMDEHDLLELAGIILENASQWATERVLVRCVADGNVALFVVEDDGVGVSDDKIAQLGIRGLRLDENSAGEGLGLSIAFEIVRLNSGTIDVSRGQLGGLRVAVRLPLTNPRPLLSAAQSVTSEAGQ